MRRIALDERAMKQVAQNYRTGEIKVVEVPRPRWRPGGVVVENTFSLISTGTERMKVDQAKMSLLGKARARPDQLKQVLDSVSQQGIVSTYRKVSDRLDSLTPLGYSAAGVVVESGQGAEDLPKGTRVACGGDQFAFHAQYNWVPRNLCVPVPDGVADGEAAFTTVGAIAMQAVRQSELRLGETAAVIGLGLVGQLILRILVAAGVQVVGLDLSNPRCQLALRGGVLFAAEPGDPDVRSALSDFTDGAGADCVVLATSTSSNEPAELAAELARDRARVVDVGNTRLDLPWKAYYEKELEVRFSRSYGPGRYDPAYEIGGADYPIGYVRWTQRRNMKAFLRLVEERRVDVSQLIDEVVDIDDASGVYDRIHRGLIDSVGVLFRYQPSDDRGAIVDPSPDVPIAQPPATPRSDGVGIGSIGCGNYATSMLLPHLRRMKSTRLVSVVTTGGLSAANAQEKFGFWSASSDPGELLENPHIDVVMILTRHDTHADLVQQALRSGKFVYVEKPLAINQPELGDIREAVGDSGNSRLMVGYNRRFAPLLGQLRSSWRSAGPQQITYVVNAGQLDTDSWYANRAMQGSRFVGEGGHFVDTLSWWIGDDPTEVYARASSADQDDLQVLLSYPDGSVAHIAYLTNGDRRFTKERITFVGGNQVAVVDNFARGELWSGGKRRRFGRRGKIDKGQESEMAALVSAADGKPTEIADLESLIATSAATFAVEASIRTGRPEAVADYMGTSAADSVSSEDFS